MRPPFLEAVALLAAHGFPILPFATNRRPRMPATSNGDPFRFALFRDQRAQKPLGFPDIDALARHIQRQRAERGLLLEPKADLELEGDTVDRPGVSVFATDADGNREILIGHAYIEGQPVELLQAAIRRNRLVIIQDEAA